MTTNTAFEIGKYIAQLYRSGNYFFSHTVDSVEIGSGHIAIIFYLYQNPNCSQDDLTKAIEVDKATITRSLSKLEQAKIVSRTADEHDKRIKRINLTEKGECAFQEIKNATHTWHNVLLEGFDAEEIKQLDLMFEKLIQNARAFRDLHCKAKIKSTPDK